MVVEGSGMVMRQDAVAIGCRAGESGVQAFRNGYT